MPNHIGPANTIRDESRRTVLADNRLMKSPEVDRMVPADHPVNGQVTKKAFIQSQLGGESQPTESTASTRPASQSQTRYSQVSQWCSAETSCCVSSARQ